METISGGLRTEKKWVMFKWRRKKYFFHNDGGRTKVVGFRWRTGLVSFRWRTTVVSFRQETTVVGIQSKRREAGFRPKIIVVGSRSTVVWGRKVIGF